MGGKLIGKGRNIYSTLGSQIDVTFFLKLIETDLAHHGSAALIAKKTSKMFGFPMSEFKWSRESTTKIFF